MNFAESVLKFDTSSIIATAVIYHTSDYYNLIKHGSGIFQTLLQGRTVCRKGS